MRYLSVLFAIAVVLLLSAQIGSAQILDGTADMTITVWNGPDLPEDEISVVTYGTFFLQNQTSNHATLVLSAEYGPQDVVEAIGVDVDWAGQLYVELPIALSSAGYSRQYQVDVDDFYATYDEWKSTTDITFSGAPNSGSIEVIVRATSGSLIEVDAELILSFIDPIDNTERIVSALLFGEEVTYVASSPSTTSRPAYDPHSHHHHGCGGDTYVGVETEPTRSSQDSGCAGDEVSDDSESDYSSDSSGCAGDEIEDEDDEEPYSNDSGCGDDSVNDDSGPACAGDDTSGGSSTDNSSGDEGEEGNDPLNCAGDDVSDGRASAVSMGRSLRRHAQPFMRHVNRTFHIWSPFVIVLVLRRRRR